MKAIIKPHYILLITIFLIHLFFHFYNIEQINLFGWDQVDNAWAAKDIIVDHKMPLVGMVAKGNSGFYIGPLYYYLISIVYYLTHLDPIASGIFAGLTSIFTFWTLFYITKKLFNFQTALLAVFIHTISFFVINADRVQWPVNFIAPISLIVFYTLYKVIIGQVKYIIPLSIALGISFHIHFTSIFYPLIIVLTLPFFPKTKETVKYLILGSFLFIIWLIPLLVSELTSKASSSKNLMGYANSYYHGFHFKRMLQLAADAFIEFESILYFKFLKPLVFFLLPFFSLLYLNHKPSREKKLLCYLVWLWFLVPWIVFTTYSGEISNYYFSFNRLVAILVLSYVSVKIFEIKNMVPKIAIASFWLYYSIINIQQFFTIHGYKTLSQERKEVQEAIHKGKVINFTIGDGESYLYYVYSHK